VLASVFFFGLVAEVVANGVTGLVWVEVLLVVGMLVCAYDDD
jgi:hypothetical protein